jgi:hypothetical protein
MEYVTDERFRPGDPVKVTGLRGRFFFVRRARSALSEWCEVYGVAGNVNSKRAPSTRSVDPERVLPDPTRARRAS